MFDLNFTVNVRPFGISVNITFVQIGLRNVEIQLSEHEHHFMLKTLNCLIYVI